MQILSQVVESINRPQMYMSLDYKPGYLNMGVCVCYSMLASHILLLYMYALYTHISAWPIPANQDK